MSLVLGTAGAAGTAPAASVLRAVVATVAALGAVNAVTGATPLVPNFGTASGFSVAAGTSVSVFYTVNGTQTPPMSWTVEGNIPPGLNFSGLTSPGFVNIGSLHLAGTPTQSGTYAVTLRAWEFTNEGGSGSPLYNYTITVTGSTATAPAITQQPASQAVNAGASASFTVAASGSPTPTFQWRKGGSPIAGATSATYAIASVAPGDAGTYSVVATNSAGTATSNDAVLTVNVAPQISAQPANQTVTAGSPVSFTVTATGSPAPGYQWRKNGADVAGATSATYAIAAAAAGDAGNYTVVVTNVAGTVTSSIATLTVNPASNAPGFSAQPGGQLVAPGGTAVFTVTATGNPTPTLRWQVSPAASGTWTDLADGGSYSGTGTATLTVTGVTVALTGAQYRCVATNGSGSTASNAASLTVNVPANSVDFGTTTFPAVLAPGVKTTFSATVTNSGSQAWGANHYLVLRDANSANLAFASLSGVAPGASVTVSFKLTAPGTTGGYGYFLQALENNVAWFPNQLDLHLDVRRAGLDLNSDGSADIVWQDTATGERGVWLMNQGNFTAWQSFGVVPTEWRLATIADFNGDGQPDFLWEDTVTGERGLWLMNGVNFSAWQSLGVVPTEWRIATAADLDGDGRPDILWEDTVTGERGVWLMNGTVFTGWISYGVVPPEWRLAAAADFNGDGSADLLWENTTTGERGLWLMSGANFSAWLSLGVVPTEWRIAAVGDYDGNGRPDILWEDTVTGERGLWLMNGLTFTAWVSFGVVPVEWTIAN